MRKISFTNHPKAVGETYLQHAKAATKIGLCLIYSGVSCLLHALFPFLHQKTASKRIKRLYDSCNKRGLYPKKE